MVYAVFLTTNLSHHQFGVHGFHYQQSFIPSSFCVVFQQETDIYGYFYELVTCVQIPFQCRV